jgi:putative membrane protein
VKIKQTDHALLAAAVERAEQKTGAEIVLSIRTATSSNADVAALLSNVAATLALAFVVLSDVEFDVQHLAPIVLGAGWLVYAVTLLVVPPGRLSPARTRRNVDDAAHAAFSRNGVHRTRGRTGILVFYALRERAGRILFDTGVTQAVPVELRDEWRTRLHDCRNAQDLVALIEHIGERSAPFLPRGDDDVDELSNSAEVVS